MSMSSSDIKELVDTIGFVMKTIKEIVEVGQQTYNMLKLAEGRELTEAEVESVIKRKDAAVARLNLAFKELQARTGSE